jgi:5-(carboxyamino)imidazole ribonucleotide mutase
MRHAPHRVLILIGSDSDAPVMRGAVEILERFEIESDLHVASAHRSPERAIAFARDARDNGYSAIIAGAGLAAHLPGVLAAVTTLPVIGVPICSGPLQGQDALLAIAQMPRGVPVATVAIGNAHNAGVLAARMIGIADAAMAERLAEYAEELAAGVERADAKLQRTLAQNDDFHMHDDRTGEDGPGDGARRVAAALGAAT